MPLKLTRGFSSLTLLPLRIRIIAALLLMLCVTAIVVSESGASHPDFKPSGVAEKTTVGNTAVTENVKAVSGSQVATDASSPVVKTAKIVTCPRCRLNALPLVKKFVYTHAKLFEPGLKVDFIPGEDPTLFLYENGKEIDEIDLEEYTWKTIIKKLVDFGIPPSEQTADIKEALSGAR